MCAVPRQVYPMRELAGCVSLQELVLHGLQGGRWSGELGAWVTAGHVRSLRLVDCRCVTRAMVTRAVATRYTWGHVLW